jgi:hypothetical protein
LIRHIELVKFERWFEWWIGIKCIGMSSMI